MAEVQTLASPGDGDVHQSAFLFDAARFKRPGEPGDQLKMEVQIVRTARGIWKYKASASVDGQLAVEAELMCTMRNAADASQPAVQ